MELSELTLDNLVKQSIGVRIMALVLIFLVILFLIYWLLLKPRLFQLNTAKKQQQDLRSTYKIQQAKVEKLPFYEKEWAVTQSIDDNILSQLIGKNEFSDVLKTISQLSVEDNVDLISLNPESEIKQWPYIAIPIRIELNGDFLHLTQFLNQILGLSKLITIQDISFTSTVKTHRVFLKMKIMAYRYSGEKINNPMRVNLSNAEILTTKAKNRVFQRDPFSLSLAILNHNKNLLSKYTLASLRMVGTVEYRHQRWALISTEDDLVFSVTIGMRLGEREGRVVEIGDRQVKVMQTSNNGEKRVVNLKLQEE